MFLSKLVFQSTPRFLRSNDVISGHRLVMSLFPSNIGEDPRSKLKVLWRREDTNWGTTFLIQSGEAPSLNNVKTPTVMNSNLQTRDIADVYSNFLSQEDFSYKIRVNPVVMKAGKRVPVKGTEEIAEWWAKSFERSSRAQADREKLVVLPEDVATGKRKNGTKVVINSATIIGRAVHEDRQLLMDSIQEGFGKAKSYGFGLMMLGA